MEYIETQITPIPKDGKEYLTKNNLQGGVKSLIRWDKIKDCFTDKGKYIAECNVGTHWFDLDQIKDNRKS